MTHTKTPLSTAIHGRVCRGNDVVADCNMPRVSPRDADAMAERLVRAANAHAPLVATVRELRAILRDVTRFGNDEVGIVERANAIRRAEAALKLAEKGE